MKLNTPIAFLALTPLIIDPTAAQIPNSSGGATSLTEMFSGVTEGMALEDIGIPMETLREIFTVGMTGLTNDNMSAAVGPDGSAASSTVVVGIVMQLREALETGAIDEDSTAEDILALINGLQPQDWLLDRKLREIKDYGDFGPCALSCSPFPVKRFFDGVDDCAKGSKSFKSSKSPKSSKSSYPGFPSYDEDLTFNSYAWGADYDFGVGVMIHSGGTPAVLDGKTSRPTLVLRDEHGVDFFKTTLPIKVTGLRSALVWDVTKDAQGTVTQVVILTGSIQVDGTESSLLMLVIDVAGKSGGTSKSSKSSKSKGRGSCDESVEIITLLGPGANQSTGGTSIRSLRRLDNSNIAYVPLNDGGIGGSSGPTIVRYNVDTGVKTVLLLDLEATAAAPLYTQVPTSIWDFKIQGFTVWYALTSAPVLDPTKAANFNIIPTLVYGSSDDLLMTSAAIPVTYKAFANGLVPAPPGESPHQASALSLQPIGDNQVHVCTLSGFLFQGLFGGVGDLEGVELSRYELGNPQQCWLCNATASPDDCVNRTPLPDSQNPLSAYIWDQESCDGKVFVGTLDIVNIVALVVKFFLIGEISDFLGIPPPDDITDFPIISLILDIISYVIVSIFIVEEPVFLADRGFNLCYIEESVLISGSYTIDDWKVVTRDGFSRVDDDGNELGIIAWLVNQRSIEDGVRNMVCHNDKALVVGTAVYYDEPSTTYVLDLEGPPNQCRGPLDDKCIF